MSQLPVRVLVPATSANLGPGFDSFGLALARYDEVSAGLTDGGLLVEVTGVGADEVPLTHEHLVVRAIARSFAAGGVELPGLHLRCVNCIPHGGGLGSSAAAIVGGLLLGRELLVRAGGRRLSDEEILALGTEMEGHPDNVAPALFGGFTLAYTDDDGRPVAVRCAVHPGHPGGGVQRAPVQLHPSHPGSAAGDGSARRRQRQRGGRRTARARADHRPVAPVGGHQGPAAPGLPGAGDAGVGAVGRGAAAAPESLQ